MQTCQICETRRPRRFCPGINGEICSICCGTEREQTVHCPFDCEYLREAREHEKLPDINPDDFPNKEIRVTERFLRDNEELLLLISSTLLQAALETPGAVDSDVREALASLVRTHLTLESGLYYETRPTNPLAGNIHQGLQAGLQEYRRQLAERTGVNTVRDADVLGVLVFLQRLEVQHNNGRRLGRAFLDFLRAHFQPGQPAASPLIVP
jgi:hypothetical protein